MQHDIVPDEELINGEMTITLDIETSITDSPGIDDRANNPTFGIIAELPGGHSLDAVYMGRLEERFSRAATLGDEALCEMDLDTMDDAKDDDQLESDDPEVVAPIPLPHSGIKDHQQVLTTDALNNSYVCVGEAAIAGDLIAGGLLPTSFSHFWTFFTMAMLDDFWLSNLECKSLAYQYWNKISRAGAPATSSLDVDDFYRELLVADGNFKADHVRQSPLKTGKERIPDIWSGEGGQFMTPLPLYLKYLKEKQNSKPTKAPCENPFRVLEQAMLLSKACDIKGIVALACAWRGCFILTCVADLPVGEQQKNVDYILRELFQNGNFGEVRRILFMYDIVCQYIVHLTKHLGPDILEHLTIDQAIGLMHVHGHKDDCF
ncbi:hypothetical protein DXG01_013697 [Tephrocybe rancida]|nr:hypothetical protein DXG01_013697 [Tephrocybe rancida]